MPQQLKIFDINNKLISINVSQRTFPLKPKCKSKKQKQVQSILTDIYKQESVLEDFIIPKSKLSIDFFIPRLGIVIEVQGKQHINYVSYFHGEKTLFKFQNQQQRDMAKSNWCLINNFELIEINYDDDESTIRRKITGKTTRGDNKVP